MLNSAAIEMGKKVMSTRFPYKRWSVLFIPDTVNRRPSGSGSRVLYTFGCCKGGRDILRLWALESVTRNTGWNSYILSVENIHWNFLTIQHIGYVHSLFNIIHSLRLHGIILMGEGTVCISPFTVLSLTQMFENWTKFFKSQQTLLTPCQRREFNPKSGPYKMF